jgi:hypothetical protein
MILIVGLLLLYKIFINSKGTVLIIFGTLFFGIYKIVINICNKNLNKEKFEESENKNEIELMEKSISQN